MGLRRLSQAVVPVSPGDADPNRYVYLTPENAEPGLGLPDGNGYILFSNTDGSRSFTEIGNLLIEGGGILIDANGRISVDPNILVNVNVSANIDVTRTGFTRFDYLSPNGQVLLAGTDTYGNELELSSNDQVLVYINGFLLQPTVDYTYANGYSNANVESAVILDIPISRENSTVSIHRYSPTLFAQGPDGNAAFSGSSDDIPEGFTNLFFTNARARAAFSASDGIDYDEANGIFTANLTTTLIPEGANLYFTNARAVAAVQDVISTSNVLEGANLYFSNTRAVGALTAGSGVIIQANGLIIADSATAFSGNTDSVPEGTSNLYYTNARVFAAITGENVSIFNNDAGYITDAALTTSNITEGANLYFTNARVKAYIDDNITTSNIIEGANLYFTNARVAAALTAGIITADKIAAGAVTADKIAAGAVTASKLNSITTSNIAEGANLYFTNTRSVGSLTAGDNIVIESNGLIVATATLGGAIPTLYTPNIVEAGDVVTGNVYFTQARARAAINAGFGLTYDNTTGTVYVEDGAISTSNITEGANLYFTNTRAIGSLTAGDNITIEANGLIISSATLSSLPTLYTSNIVEDGNTTTGNVYFSNTRARGAFTFGPGLTFNSTTGSLQANVRSVNGLTGIIELSTANIAEGGSNLYFSNTRAITAFTAGPGIESANLANGILSTTTVVDTTTVANVLSDIDTVVIGNLIPSIASGRNLGNITHPWKELWISGQTIRLGNLVIREANGRLLVSNATTGNIAFSTDDLIETADKLFFTNARARAAFVAGNNISSADLANGTISSIFGNSNVVVAVDNFITSSNVKEGANLYFTNTRSRRAFTAGTGINAANLALGIITVETSGSGILSGFVNASNVIETGNPTTGNVFFTNARARSAFTAGTGINTANLANGIVQADVRSVAGKTGVVLLFTPNIIESGNTTLGNVYFSNARARQAFTAGANIDAAQLANGIIAFSDVAGGGIGSFTGANIIAGDGISVSVAVDGNVLITNEGVISIAASSDAANSITVTTSGGNASLSLSPNVFVSQQLNANNIVANTLVVNGSTILNQSGLLAAYINASNVIETGSPTTGNVFFSNVRARRAFTAGSGINPTNLELGIISTDFGQLDLTTTSTDALPEGASNLYFTNARAQAAVANLDISIFNNDAGYLTATDPVVIDPADVFVEMEAINTGTGHGNIAFNPVTGTISFDKVTNANVRTAFSAGSGIAITDGVISLTGSAAALFDGNTDALPEGVNNLYFTNARVLSYLEDNGLEDLTVDNITILGQIITNGTGGDIGNVNLISTISIAAYEWYGISTSNVVEGANLYFTNARAVAAVQDVISAFNNADYVTNANVRTYFGASGQGLEYDNTTGIFSLDVSLFTDVQNLELANAAAAGNVLVINNDGTVDPIESRTVTGDVTASSSASGTLPIVFPASGANRQYYNGTTAYDHYRTASSAFGHDNIMVTLTRFHDGSAVDGSDFGLVAKAVKWAANGESFEQVGSEYVSVATGNVGRQTSTSIHVVYDSSSPELGYVRFFLFYSIGAESATEDTQVIESITVDPATLAITRQNITTWKYDRATWPGISGNTLDVDTSTSWIHLNLQQVKQDPHNPGRIWFSGIWNDNDITFLNAWRNDHLRIGYFDIESDGSVSYILAKNLKDILEYNPEITQFNTTYLWKDVVFDLDPTTPNKFVFAASGNLSNNYTSYVHRIWYAQLLVDGNIDVINDTGLAAFVQDIVWHPTRNNIYARALDSVRTYTINASDQLTLVGTTSLSSSSNPTIRDDGSTVQGGRVIVPSKLYVSSKEAEKNSLILVIPAESTDQAQKLRSFSFTLNSSTGAIDSSISGSGLTSYSKFISENAASTGTENSAQPIGFNTYGDNSYFYTLINNWSSSASYTQSLEYIAWGALEYVVTNFDRRKFVGVLQEAGSAGDVRSVAALGSTSNAHDNLIPGEEVYVDTFTGAYANAETGSNFKIGLAIGTSNVLLYNHTLGEKDDTLEITGVTNSGTGLGSISYNRFTGQITFNKVDTSSILNQITGTNPITVDDGVVSLNVGDNLTVNAGGYLTGVSSFVTQDAIDAVLPAIEADNSGTGHGNIAFNSSTGTITYNRVTAANIRAEFSAGGGLTYNNGVYAVRAGDKLTVNATQHLNVSAPSAAEVYGFFSADNSGTGYGSLTYNQATGEFTFTRVTDADIRARFSNGYGLNFNSSTGVFEVANTEIRGLFSAVNVGTGYGSLAYDNGIGRYTYTKVTSSDIETVVQTAINNGSISTGGVSSTSDLQVKSLGVGTAASGTTGEIIATNDITAFYSSDQRLKTNVCVIENALEKVNNIRGVTFDWNDTAQEMYPDRTHTDVGVIAQEIEKVLPEVVVDRDNGFKAVRYDKIIPLLIEAIKDLKQEIEELKKNR